MKEIKIMDCLDAKEERLKALEVLKEKMLLLVDDYIEYATCDHPVLKLRKLCRPMEELIGLTKALKIREDNVDENELKRYNAIYQKMLEITKEIKPMFEEIMKTVE